MNKFFQSLQEKGIPQKFAIYGAGAWAVIEVLSFFVQRYHWPDIIIDLVVTFLLGLIPILFVQFWFTNAANPKPKYIIGSVFFIIMIFGLCWIFLTKKGNSKPIADSSSENTILVLPFHTDAEMSKGDYFAEGITSSIIAELSRIEGAVVFSEAVSRNYKSGEIDLNKINTETHTTYLVSGHLQRQGDKVKINVSLVKVANGLQIWADKFENNLTNIFQIQDDIAQRIRKSLSLNIGKNQSYAGPKTRNIAAYDNYLKGKFHGNSGSESEIDTAIYFMKKAVEDDPKFAKAHAELSILYSKKNHLFAHPKINYNELAFLEGEKALSLDSTLAEVYYARGYYSWTAKNKFPHIETIKLCNKAIALNPRYYDAINLLAKIYIHVGLLDEARIQLKKSLSVNPLNGYALADLASIEYFLGKYPEATEAFKRVPNSYLEDAYWKTQKLIVMLQTGQKDLAMQEIKEKVNMNNKEPLFNSVYAVMLAHENKKEEAQQQIRIIEGIKDMEAQALTYHHVTYYLSVTYALLGDNEKAIKWLRWTAENGFPCYVFFKNDPLLQSLKQNKDFLKLLSEIELNQNKILSTQ